jgi:hypothetical protein
LKLADAAGEIASGLLDLTREGGPGNFMVVSSGDIYVQFAGSPGNPQVVCESISNEYLPKTLRMSRESIDRLQEFGFVLGGDEIENFSRSYEITSEEHAREVAEAAIQILKDVYALPKSAEVQIELSLE